MSAVISSPGQHTKQLSHKTMHLVFTSLALFGAPMVNHPFAFRTINLISKNNSVCFIYRAKKHANSLNNEVPYSVIFRPAFYFIFHTSK